MTLRTTSLTGGNSQEVKDEMEDSVREYFELLFDKLNKLVIEDISYSDYDQMTDRLGEIKNHVKRIEKKQKPMKVHGDDSCPRQPRTAEHFFLALWITSMACDGVELLTAKRYLSHK